MVGAWQRSSAEKSMKSAKCKIYSYHLSVVFAFILLFANSIIGRAEQQELHFYVPNSPPQGLPSGEKKGIMVDVAVEAARRAGYRATIEMLPWPRTLAYVKGGKNLFIAGLSRHQSREDSYTWVYPVFTLWRTFITTGQRIDSYEEGRTKLKSVATHFGSLEISMLQEKGFSESQIVKITNETDQIDFLLSRRIDALYRPAVEIQWLTRGRQGVEKLVYGELMQPTSQYIACSLDCSEDIVLNLQSALKAMDEDGTLQRIIGSYTEQ